MSPSGTAPARSGLPAWWRALWPGVAALVAVMGVGRFVYTPILPEMLADGALTLPAAGWVASANFLGYLAGAMAASAIRSRPAQGWLARAGLALTVATLAAMAVLDGVSAWMAVRFLAGAASALALVFVSAQVIERLVALGQAERMVWMYAGVGGGIAGSALLALVGQGLGWPWPAWWWASAAFAGVFAVFAWRGAASVGVSEPSVGAGSAIPPVAASTATATATAPAPAQSPAAAPTAAGQAASPRAFRAMVVAYGLFGLGYVIHATYLPAMVRASGAAPEAGSWIWVLVGVAALPATLLWMRIARRHGVRAAIVGCYAVQGLTALVPLAGNSLGGAAIAAIGLGGTFLPVTGLALPFARAFDPARGARAIALMTVAFGVGQIVGPLAAAYLAADYGFGGPSVLACVVLLAAAALMRPRRDAPA